MNEPALGAAVSSLIHSADYTTQTDDRLKDEDNVAWVMKLSGAARTDWLTTLQWVRAPDRLLESQLFGHGESREAGAAGFETFMLDWQALRAGGVPGSTRFRALFLRLAERWRREGITEQMLDPWDGYLEALWRYRLPQLETADEYVAALYGLSGTFFQALPYQPPGLSSEVAALGALDQFFNNLRDLHEDTVRGICYYPADLLARFGLCREEMPDLLHRVDARLVGINEHLLATVVPRLRQDCARLLTTDGLHDSWREMLRSVRLRHSRVEYVAQLCRFNPADFGATYWQLVRDDLARALRGSRRAAPPGPEQPTARHTPFHLRGNYAPVHEEVTSFDLAVDGEIPRSLVGRYLRNGPNPRVGDTAHWFFGDGMIHGIELADGRATSYRNRWVRTNGFREGRSTMSADGTIDLANTHVFVHAGRVLALMETSGPTEIGTKLDTVGRHDFGGRLSTPMTAHPKRCPTTGELHFFGYGFVPPLLTYHRVDAGGSLVQTEVIDVPGATMIHDFALTRNHVVFFDLPVIFDFGRFLEGTMPYRWSDDYGARLGVMPRGGPGRPVRWYEVEPGYAFHTVNAFEHEDRIVVDVVRYDELWRDSPSRFGPAALHRWTIDQRSGVVREEALDDRPVEFPRADDRLTGFPYRYCYTLQAGAFDETGPVGASRLYKHDLARGSVDIHDFGPGRMPGEGVFVPASPDAGEDEGYVMTYVYDAGRETSDFVILDASDFPGPPIASVQLPQRVPFGFHGSWVADVA